MYITLGRFDYRKAAVALDAAASSFLPTVRIVFPPGLESNRKYWLPI